MPKLIYNKLASKLIAIVDSIWMPPLDSISNALSDAVDDIENDMDNGNITEARYNRAKNAVIKTLEKEIDRLDNILVKVKKMQ